MEGCHLTAYQRPVPEPTTLLYFFALVNPTTPKKNLPKVENPKASGKTVKAAIDGLWGTVADLEVQSFPRILSLKDFALPTGRPSSS